MDTLALGYTLPAIGRVTDLHRLENVRAGRTIKGKTTVTGDLPFFLFYNYFYIKMKFSLFFYCCLRRRESGDRHSEWRA